VSYVDSDEYMTIWQTLEPYLRKLIYYRIPRADMVDDLMQTLFVNVYPKRQHLEVSYLPRYLTRAAVRLANERRSPSRMENKM
jgi:DNA-directed RNA polymerase specialized sigma24 family protein